MKLNIHSITFKTIATLLVASSIFIITIISSAKYMFSDGYMQLEKDKISVIEKNIIPSIALNLSYGFEQAIYEIGSDTILNQNILLLKIKSINSNQTFNFKNSNLTLKNHIVNGELYQNKNFLTQQHPIKLEY